MNKIPLVYVAHKYGSGFPGRESLNTASAKSVGAYIMEAGGNPINPLLNYGGYNHLSDSANWDHMIRLTSDMLSVCDAAFFSLGWEESVGCGLEMEQCKKSGIPHFTNFTELKQFIKEFQC